MAGDWRLGPGDCWLEFRGWRLVAGDWWLGTGGWRLVAWDWKAMDQIWKPINDSNLIGN